MTRIAAFFGRTAPLLVLGLLLLTLLAACGRKGPVRPQLASLPAAPGDVQIAQQGIDFLLSWTIPAYNQDASPAEDLTAFRIFRLVYDAAEGCPTCRDPDVPVATITLNQPAPAVRLGKRLYWRDGAVAPGTGHAYLVVPVTIGGHDGAGAGAYRTFVQPPPPPANVQIEAGPGRLQLSWQPPTALPEDQTLLGYNLYRRPAGSPFPPLPLNQEPLRDAQLTDFAAEGAKEAAYRITTVTRSGDQVLESAPSTEVTATPAAVR